MLANIERMSEYLKEIEHKSQTKQMDMFDLGVPGNSDGGLILIEAEPLSFEDTIREERNTIGISISGDPLDGLGIYIEKKSLWLVHVKEFLKLLEENIEEISTWEEDISENDFTAWEQEVLLDAPEEIREPTKEKKEKPIVQIIWIVDTIRKIQTKKWENMLIVWCSSTWWKFTTIIFPKNYNLLAYKIKIGEIILVKWKLNCKIELKEISIEAEQIKSSTISNLRLAAQNEGIFDYGTSTEWIDNKEASQEGIKNTSRVFEKIQKKYSSTIENNSITIHLKKDTEKEILYEIKSFLDTFPVWPYHVFIDIQWHIIDTKKSIGDK